MFLNVSLTVLCAVVAYLLGSISVSVLISKFLYKDDVREHGSHNAGATNMARVYGLIGGVAVLVGDFLKAVVAMGLPWLLGLIFPEFTSWRLAYAIAGATCLVGHAYPVFFGFKGGKGVTVGAAIALMSDWRSLLIILTVFVVVFVCTKIVSISSVSAATAFAVTGICFYAFGIADFNLYLMILSVFAGAMVVFLHRGNLVRLARGEEKKFTYKKTKRVAEENKDEK